jgi:hypothetical protein
MGQQKRRRVATNQVDTAARSSLADMLAATAQHSVPILPAENSSAPDASGTRKSISYARKTLAPIPSVRADASAPSVPLAQPSAPTLPERTTTRHATQARRTRAPRPSDPLHDDAPPDEQPGLPTFVLPSITSTQLPAVVPDEQRAVAIQQAAEQPALLIRGSKRLPRAYAPLLAPRRRGPRPFAAQFIISMVTVMVLFTTLTLASPLGHAGTFANAFQAYANTVPWVPTPTPTPRPTPTPVPYSPPLGANPGQQAVINEIVAVFGPYAQGALNVSRCESGYDPNAVNPYAIGNSHASGVFQILYPSTWDTTSYAAQSPFDYNANIHAAYEIFSRDGHAWSEWACKP